MKVSRHPARAPLKRPLENEDAAWFKTNKAYSILASGQFMLIVGESSNTLSIYKIDSTAGSITLPNNTNLPSGSGVRFLSPLLTLQ